MFPWPVQKYLDDRDMHCVESTRQHGDFGGMRLCVLYLEDSLGPLQYVLPESHMLRLNTMSEVLGRNFTVMAAVTRTDLFKKHDLDEPTGLLPLTQMHTLIDNSILGHSHYLLPSGRKDALMVMTADQLDRLIEESQSEKVNFSSDSRRPWPPEHDDESMILASVQNLTSLRIRQRLIETLEIPPLPDSARRILRLRLDPDARVEELAAIVEMDPSLNAQLICWASSPYYGAQVQVSTAYDAISRVLGFDMVLNMTLGLSLGKTLSLPKDGPTGLKPYWEQAVMAALAMQRLIQKMPRSYHKQAATAYLCGLLHNFGFVVLGHLFPMHFSLICRHIEANPHIPVANIEHLLLGVNRNQLAAWLLQTWGMPEEVVIAIRFQDMPAVSPEPDLFTRALHLCTQLLCGADADDFIAMKLPIEANEAQEVIESLIAEQGEQIRMLANQMVS